MSSDSPLRLPRPHLAGLLLLLTLLPACSGDSSPSAPESALSALIYYAVVGPVDGGVVEATLLLDGREIDGARRTCFSDFGCNPFDIQVEAPISRGQHTLSFQILEHTRALRPYDGSLSYTGAGQLTVIDLGPTQSITLDERNRALGPGDTITYTFVVDP